MNTINTITAEVFILITLLDVLGEFSTYGEESNGTVLDIILTMTQ